MPSWPWHSGQHFLQRGSPAQATPSMTAAASKARRWSALGDSPLMPFKLLVLGVVALEFL